MGKLKSKLLLGIGIYLVIFSSISILLPHTAKAEPPTFSYLNMYQIVGSDNSIYQTASGLSTVNNDKIEFIKIYPDPLKSPNKCTSSTLEYSKKDETWKYFEMKSGSPPCDWKAGVKIPAPSNAENTLKLYTWSTTSDDTVRRFGYGNIAAAYFTKVKQDSHDVYRTNTSNKCSETLYIEALPSANYYGTGQKPFATYWNVEKQSIDYRKVEKSSGTTSTITGCPEGTLMDQEGTGTAATVNISWANFNVDVDKYNEVTPAQNGTTFATLTEEQKKALTNGAGPAEDDTANTCEAKIPALGWIICQIAGVVDSLANWVSGVLSTLLTIGPQEYGEGSGAGGTNSLKVAWSSISILATIALVGIALFMIIAQIFDFDFVSAYTIKKVIPKLVLAIVLIQLSWFLTTTFIQIINVVGAAMDELITAPFGGADLGIKAIMSKYYTSNGGNQIAAASAAVISGIVIAGGVAAVGGGFGLLAAALGVAIAIMVGILTLVLRKVILIVLIVISPIAIVLWILPNTQKYWKMWSENFMKLMLMFPMIMGLLAVGKVFAYITASIKASGGLTSTVNYFVILIAYFGPFLLIPKTFSLSGSILASASGMVNKMSGKISAPSQKLIKEKGTDWAQSKYKPGQSGRNALVRLGTGKLIPTTKSSARLAGNRLKYMQELEGQGNALVAARLEGENYSDQGETLQELANSSNKIVSEAAMRRINETGRHELLEGVDQKKIKAYADKNAEFGKGMAQKRRDLVDPTASKKMVTKDFIGSHDSIFGSVDSNGAYTPPTGDHPIDFSDSHVQEQLRAIAADQTLYNQMGNAAKHIIGPPTFDTGGGGGPTGPAAGGGGGPTGPAAGGGGGPTAYTYRMPTGAGTRSSSTGGGGGNYPPTPPPTQPPPQPTGPSVGGGSPSSSTGGATTRTTTRWTPPSP